jgi:hypothetical protein
LSAGLALRVAAQDLVFDNRASVNIMAATNVVVTAGVPSGALDYFRANYTDGVNYDATAVTNWIQVDFRTTRNIKTLRLSQWNGYHITNGYVVTSTDGSTWTPQTTTMTQSGAGGTEFALSSAVDARYLRLVELKTADAGGRWIVFSFRVLGDTGTLTDTNGVMDLVTGGGWSGGVTLSPTGVISITDTTYTEFLNDALWPIKRQVLYNITTNEGAIIQFDRDFIVKMFAFTFPVGDAGSTVTIATSTNGTDYTTVGSKAGGLSTLNYINLTPSRARYVRCLITATTVGDNRVADLQVFGLPPTTNRAPTAASQSVGTTANEPKAITLTGSDPDADPLTFILASSPTRGTLSGAIPNYTYTPWPNYSGPDSFTFRVTDGVFTSAVATVAITVASSGTLTFDNRANVNVLNASNAVVTCGQQTGMGVSNLRASYFDGFWDGAAGPAGGTNWVQVDFREPRNIKTIRMSQYSDSQMTTGTVSTSSDGASWVNQSVQWSVSGLQTDLRLDAAVDARYLRITATDIADGNGLNRWILYSLRVFGDTGTLVDTNAVVDLVSRTGWSGGVTLTRNGTVSITDATDAEYVDDALSPIKRQVLYSVGSGDGFTLQFDREFVFNKLGLFFVNGYLDASMQYTVETSTNGVSYTNVLTQSGGLATYLNHLGLTPSQGRYLRFTCTSSSSGDNRISDIQVFGTSVPFPPPPPPRGILMLMR